MVEIPKPKKPSAALWWIGILIIIVGLYMAFNILDSAGGWYHGDTTDIKLASLICGASLLVGMCPMVYYIVLERKHSRVIENEKEAIVMEQGIHFPAKVSSIPLLVSCCLLFGSFVANWMLGDTESEFLFLGGMLLLIYYLVLVMKRENRVKGLAEEM